MFQRGRPFRVFQASLAWRAEQEWAERPVSKVSEGLLAIRFPEVLQGEGARVVGGPPFFLCAKRTGGLCSCLACSWYLWPVWSPVDTPEGHPIVAQVARFVICPVAHAGL